MFSRKRSCIVFSVPRSGTHLVMRLLSLLGLKEFMVDWSSRKNLFNVPKHEYYAFGSHTANTLIFNKLLIDNDLKGIYIIRDLRDTAVSLTFFLERIKKHPYNDFLMKLNGFDERLTSVIKGIDELCGEAVFPSLAQRYVDSVGWRLNPNVFSTFFESLVGSKGGGSVVMQRATIDAVCKHLKVKCGERALTRVQSLLWGNRSQYEENFRRGVIGDWRNHFKQEHKDLAKRVFGAILIREGYEKDENW